MWSDRGAGARAAKEEISSILSHKEAGEEGAGWGRADLPGSAAVASLDKA